MPHKLFLPNAIKTPSGKLTKEVEIVPMTGREEDILQDQTMAPGGKGRLLKTASQRITEILSRCTVSMGGDDGHQPETRPMGQDRKALPMYFAEAWKKAFANDRGFMVIRLRQASLGDEYVFDDTCPHCKKEIKGIKVDLANLEVTSKPLSEVSDEYKFELPGSGDVVLWRPLLGADEDTLEEIRKSRKADLPSALLYLRTININGTKPSDDVIKDLSSLDRRALQSEFDAREGGIDTKIEVTCDNQDCQREFTRRMSVGHPSFFFPSAVPSVSKRTSGTAPPNSGGPSTTHSRSNRDGESVLSNISS